MRMWPGCLALSKDVHRERQPAKQRRTQHDARQDFTDHLGLTKLHEQIAQQLGQANEQQ